MKDPVILFLIDTLNTGGAERSLLDIVSAFRKYRPIVCHIYPGEVLKAEFTSRGIEIISLNIPPPYHWGMAQRAVEEVIKKTKPVLIHSSLFKSDIVSRRVSASPGIPLINSLVNNSYHPSRFQGAGLLMKIKLKIFQGLDAWTSKKVDLFISNSETIRQSNSKDLNIPLDKIKVIYRGRTASDFKVDTQVVEALRKELRISSGKRILLNVSRLILRKGQRELIRAFNMVLQKHPDTHLLIAGEGPYRANLEAEIQHLGLDDNVCLLGNRKDIPALMSLADCFVFPTHYEGLPGVLIEAMLARLPIVASNIPENLECVNDSMAYLFNSGDEQGLIAAINEGLENKSGSAAKTERAYMVAHDKFSLTKIAESYEVTYDELILKKMHQVI